MIGRFLFGKIPFVKVENAYASQLEKKGFSIRRGWDKQLARDLAAYSREEEIRAYTPRDMTERFPNERAAEGWYEARERTVYALCQDEQLAGVMWLSHEPKELLGADYTIAIRLYKAARGHGLAGNFLEAVFEDFMMTNGYAGKYWLATDISNLRAQHLYVKHGFNEVERGQGRITMVRESASL